jgi:aryl-alcohol dehydrogenase-like predicted oxidoreductase
MKKTTIGNKTVTAIGLGCMGMSFAYGPGDDNESIQVLNRSLDLGVDHWDTADMYGAGVNEQLLANVLKTRRDEVFLATKFANVFDRSLTAHQDLVEQNTPWIVDGTPAYLRKCCESSLQRLGVDTIDLYYQHRVDPRVPIEETVGEMAKLVEEGKVRHLGLSEASAQTIRRAHKTHPIAALQTEYSLWTRDIEAEILPTVRELGITLVAYSPLGRGFLTGRFSTAEDVPEGDWRRMNPRFQQEAFQQNFEIVERVKAIADRLEATPAQVALAWVLSRGQDIAPIPGTKRLKYLEQNIAADKVELSESDIASLDNFQATGSRYPETSMAFVNG